MKSTIGHRLVRLMPGTMPVILLAGLLFAGIAPVSAANGLLASDNALTANVPGAATADVADHRPETMADHRPETMADPHNGTVADTSKVYDIDEVMVVTQPKEAYRLRLQPVSSTSLTGRELSSRGLRDLRGLTAFVPSFSMPEYGSRYTSSIYVRGLGTRVNSPAVGIYVDGLPLLSKSAYNFHVYETERVDVLRGPQGTLYGMNTEGGLLRLYSKNPRQYQGTDVTLSAGSRAYRKGEVAHYGQAGSQLAYSLAGFYEGQNGFFRNTFSGEHADRYDEVGGKVRLMYQPTTRLSFDVLADYQYVRQNGFAYGLLTPEASVAEQPNTNRQGNYRRNLLNTGLTVGYQANAFDLTSTTTWQYLNDYMLMDIDYQPQDYMYMEQRQRQNALAEEIALKSRTQGPWHWTLGVFLSAQWLRTQAPVAFGPAMNQFLSQTITDYAYYGMLNAMARRYEEQGQTHEQALAQAAAIIARAGGCQIDMQMATVPGLFHTPVTNLGFFHESNVEITPRLTATLGLRYDYMHVGIDYESNALATLDESVMGTVVQASVFSALAHHEQDHFNQLLPKLGLTYRIDRHNSNVYATVAKGYRGGGYNIQMFSDILQAELQANAQTARGETVLEHDEQFYRNVAATISFKPETSWNYELGTHLNLFGNRLHADLATYFLQVKNQQLSVMAGNYGFGRMMVNAGESYSCGLEAALRGSLCDDRLTYTASYGYTRAVFKDYQDGEGEAAVNYKDNHVPFVPQHTLALSADYTMNCRSSLLQSVVMGAQTTMQGKTYWDEANTMAQRFYATLGAHLDFNLGHTTARQRDSKATTVSPVQVSLWGRNLTGTRYSTFAVQSGATGQSLTFAQRGNPFQMGVDVRLHF